MQICCSSPERFLKGDRDGWVEARPIKGTARRYSDPILDAQSKASLLSSDKARAENLMIVDLLRNDLGRFCEVNNSLSLFLATYFTFCSFVLLHKFLEDGIILKCVLALTSTDFNLLMGSTALFQSHMVFLFLPCQFKLN